MTASSHCRGNPVCYNFTTNKWEYGDGVAFEDEPDRPCIRCGKKPTKEGHDACLGHIPGVKSACCGHGVSEPILMKEEDETL